MALEGAPVARREGSKEEERDEEEKDERRKWKICSLRARRKVKEVNASGKGFTRSYMVHLQ